MPGRAVIEPQLARVHSQMPLPAASAELIAKARFSPCAHGAHRLFDWKKSPLEVSTRGGPKSGATLQPLDFHLAVVVRAEAARYQADTAGASMGRVPRAKLARLTKLGLRLVRPADWRHPRSPAFSCWRAGRERQCLSLPLWAVRLRT